MWCSWMRSRRLNDDFAINESVRRKRKSGRTYWKKNDGLRKKKVSMQAPIWHFIEVETINAWAWLEGILLFGVRFAHTHSLSLHRFFHIFFSSFSLYFFSLLQQNSSIFKTDRERERGWRKSAYNLQHINQGINASLVWSCLFCDVCTQVKIAVWKTKSNATT